MLKLITWNIQSGRTPEGRTDLGRVIACLDRFSQFDLLCLQEVAAGSGRAGDDQFAALRALLPGYAAASAVATGPGAPCLRSGCMIFSRHPLVQVLRHCLPCPPQAGLPGLPRPALEVSVAAPGGLLRVTTAHLADLAERERMAKVESLRTLHREAWLHARPDRAEGRRPFAAAPQAAPALLAGDFHMLPGSPEHQRLLDTFGDDTPPLRDCWQLAQPGRRHAPTVGLHDPGPRAPSPYTFDYVFASADLAGKLRRIRVDASEQGSDHQALLVELDWGGA